MSTFLFLIVPVTSFAIGGKSSGDIIEAFKLEEQEMLFESIPALESVGENIFEKEFRMNGIRGLIDRIGALQQSYKDKEISLSERRLNLTETIEILDTKIKESENSIISLEDSVIKKRGVIQNHRVTSLELTKKIYKNKTTILKYLSYIYSKGDNVYGKYNNIDTLKMIIMNDGDIDEILSDMLYKGLITQVGQRYIEEYREGVKQLFILNEEMDKEIITLKELQEKLEYEKSMLLSQKMERERLLEITKGQEKLFSKYIASQSEAQKTLQSAWIKAQEDFENALMDIKKSNGCADSIIQTSESCEKLELYIQREREIRTVTLTGANILEWMVPSRDITTYFHDGDYFARFGSHHDAIDIATPQGTPIRSAQDGYVTYILSPSPGGYAYIAVRHPEGYVTVYGHLSEVSVELYQYVRVGEVIGKSGGAPGTPGAGPMTTGAHLHFEVFKDKKPVDPLRFLDLKDVNPTHLATRYRQKFFDDVAASAMNKSKIPYYKEKFVIKGESTIERQKYLLSNYAAPSFRNWKLWTDEAIEAGVNPSFFMCVGLAESSLGYHLKTAYNVGNVGNTDSGSTYTFTSAKEGVYWMARTFNNKFLGKYSKVSQLSRWGNTKGAIYASSNENWHNNIIKCISMLEGRFVEDDFNFRLKKTK